MHEYVDAFGLHVEEPVRLNEFETLVHHGGRIDGHLGAHVPVGMTECRGGVHAGDLFPWKRTERATGGREDEFPGFVPLCREQALEDGRMLGIHG